MAFENQAEARRKQNVAVLGAFAAIDKNLAGIEVDIADLDVDELARAHRRIDASSFLILRENRFNT